MAMLVYRRVIIIPYKKSGSFLVSMAHHQTSCSFRVARRWFLAKCDDLNIWRSAVDGSFEILRENQKRLVVYPIIFSVFKNTSQVVVWDF